MSPERRKIKSRETRAASGRTIRSRAYAPPPLPLAYAELATASDALLRDLLPALTRELADALGIRATNVSARHQKRIVRRSQRLLLDLRGYLIADQILHGQIPRAVAAYAVAEGQLRTVLQAGGTRLRRNDDACLVLLERVARGAAPGRVAREMPGYTEARAAVDALADHTGASPHSALIDETIQDWIGLPEAKVAMQYWGRYPTVVRRLRLSAPKRLTNRLIDSLVHEYRDSAAIFELLLRRSIAIARAARGEKTKWDQLCKRSLSDLQKAAEHEAIACPAIKVLADAVQRRIRNVLAHGHLTSDVAAKRLRFTTRGQGIVEWSPSQFYSETRRVSAFVLAMGEFDAQLLYVRLRRVLATLAQSARRAATERDRPVTAKTQTPGLQRQDSSADNSFISKSGPPAHDKS